ncbi:protein FAM227B-like [Salvelinus fontinalis]|uniref:protein FAM227B-like n=1 Tax=Salvelinus fontinalis TaxID=8038 RepID=UPI0024863D0F|nr:protein FAM227B-like [Salvelinus fontinalis]
MAKQQDPEDDEEILSTFEKFVRNQGLVDWPVAFEENIEISSHFKHYSHPRQIYDYFKVNVPFPVDVTMSFSKSIEELYSKIKLHASIMSQEQSKNKNAESVFDDMNKYKKYVQRAHRIIKEQSEAVSRSLDIKDYDYPGFDVVEDTDIPGHPDALQHLDSVSEAQGFNLGFLKIWRPFFLCDLSVAVLKDTFWWFFLHTFKPNVEEESQLFDRISGAFVSLLMTVQMDLKDKLFKVYADCLAQAVYAAFYGAFPESMERLGHDFKTDLTDLISLWVSGVKPTLLSWQSWNLGWLDPVNTSGKSHGESACDLQMEFEELVSRTRRLSLSSTEKQKRGSIANADSRMDRKRESHYIGAGPEFQHVRFKPCGQSPLVSRYLHLQDIPTPAGSDTRRIRRTEITNLTPSKPTYQEVLTDVEERSHRRQQEYNIFCQQTKQEIADIHRDRLIHNMELNRMKKEIFSDRMEVKIASEGIMNKWKHPPYRQRLQKGERKEESEEVKNTNQPSVSPENRKTAGQ